MPYCDPTNVPFVVAELQRLKPRSIIDVGCGMGGWRVVVREYLELRYGRLERHEWHVIEHSHKDVGRRLLDAMLDSCNTVVLTTPVSFWDDVGIVQEQNVHQRHLSLWGEEDFAGTAGKLVELGSTFAAVVSRHPHGRGPRMQRRYDDVGLRLLIRAVGRRVLHKLSGAATT